MKQIPLTKGQFALISDEDFDYLSQWRWQALKIKDDVFYARRNASIGGGKRKYLYMHRVVAERMGIMGDIIDHIDTNSLNNTRSNLRVANNRENGANRKAKRNGTSKFLGVFKRKECRYVSSITVNRKTIYLGCFETEELAAKAYDEAAEMYHGNFARLNFPKELTI